MFPKLKCTTAIPSKGCAAVPSNLLAYPYQITRNNRKTLSKFHLSHSSLPSIQMRETKLHFISSRHNKPNFHKAGYARAR